MSRVTRLMSRRLAAFGFALGATAAACGGGAKGKSTTPTGAGAGSSHAGPNGESMNDSGGEPQLDENGNPTAGTGSDGTGAVGGAGSASAAAGDSEGPPVLPPNFDPDPAQAKVQVDQQLGVAKQALSQPTPDADGALRAARAALAIDASSVDAAAYVAFAYYHKHLYDTAELVLDDVFKREAAKSNAQVYYVYGLVYDVTARPEKAQLAYQKAIELNPNHASALVNLGVHQLKNTQYTEAQQTFERLTNQFQRTDAITMTSLGSAYRGRSADYRPGDGQRDQFVKSAEGAYKRAMQANPSYGPAYYNLGLLYLDTDPYPGIGDAVARLTTAKQYFDQYKNQPGVDIKLYDSRMKDVDKAIKRAQKKKKTS